MGIDAFLASLYDSVREAPQSLDKFSQLNDRGLGATVRNVVSAAIGAGIISALFLGPVSAIVVVVSSAGLAFLYNTRHYSQVEVIASELAKEGILGVAQSVKELLAPTLQSEPPQERASLYQFDVALGEFIKRRLNLN